MFLLLVVFDEVVLVVVRADQVDQSDQVHLQGVEGPKDEAEQDNTGDWEGWHLKFLFSIPTHMAKRPTTQTAS